MNIKNEFIIGKCLGLLESYNSRLLDEKDKFDLVKAENDLRKLTDDLLQQKYNQIQSLYDVQSFNLESDKILAEVKLYGSDFVFNKYFGGR